MEFFRNLNGIPYGCSVGRSDSECFRGTELFINKAHWNCEWKDKQPSRRLRGPGESAASRREFMMKNGMTICVLSVFCVMSWVSGCDYGPMEGLDAEAQYETHEGELKKSFSRIGENGDVGAWNFDADAPKEGISPVPADCSCTCSNAAHKACRDLKNKKGKKLCPDSAHAVDIVGSCIQDGEECGGTCECLDCYTNLGRKCGRLPAGIAGTCEFQF